MPEPRNENLPLESLLLDPDNPRLPEDILGNDQNLLIEYVAEEYDSLSIAKSISLYSYFLSEPLIAIENGNAQYVVVEGNRRLAALKLLSDKTLRDELKISDKDEWSELAESELIPDTVPVMIVSSKDEVAPIIGYRHISGIEPWEPWAKARFIASLIENSEQSFDEVAEQVGDARNKIAADYRDYRVLQRAGDFDIPTEDSERTFGVFQRAMVSPGLRSHIGAPTPADMKINSDVVPDGYAEELRELLSWLFGSDRIITDSRDISKLGRVIASVDGLKVLRETRVLNEAFIAAGGLRLRLIERLRRALSNLKDAEEDLPNYLDDDDVLRFLGECKDALNVLLDYYDGD